MAFRKHVEQGAFSDDERRRKAADMALKLSRLMGVNDSDESE